jgi:hypothetical protein
MSCSSRSCCRAFAGVVDLAATRPVIAFSTRTMPPGKLMILNGIGLLTPAGAPGRELGDACVQLLVPPVGRVNLA